jgi:ribonuclease R
MREHVGETFEGTASALVGSGVFVTLDAPFVDVLVRYEAMGPDNYQLSDDELSVVGSRSGDTISLGDRLLITIEDVAILRRQTYGRRIPPEALLNQLKDAPELPRRLDRLTTSHAGPGSKQRQVPGRVDRNAGNSRGKPQKSASGRRSDQNNSKNREPSPAAKASRGRPSRSDATGRSPSPRSDATGRGKPARKDRGRRK